ncbi:MAG: formylmethanofuran dehydrogenase subunit C [Pseudomonadota bacterium]
MSHTTVTYNGSTKFRIDMRLFSHAISQTSSITKIKKEPFLIGNKNIQIGDVFKFSGQRLSKNIVLENANSKMDYIGHRLTNNLTVEGDCGHYTGAELSGGFLSINGNTEDYAGCNLKKGTIEINGNAGNYLGSALPSDKKGMSGGKILVHGNTGDYTGDMMRRGIIMVVGNIGDYCASRMIAGTITNMGTIGKYVGRGMRRGSLLLPHKPEDITGFEDCGRHSLGYLTLLLHEMRRFESKFQSLHPMRRRVQRYEGDTSINGQGEMLIWIG